MSRKAVVIDQNSHSTTKIYVDISNAWEILPYLYENGVDEEFKDIRGILKENGRNREKYCKCEVSGKAGNMFEMRFTRNGRNDRIYCQEVRTTKGRNIVMVEIFKAKKTQDIPKKIKSRIETIGSYVYEFEG